MKSTSPSWGASDGQMSRAREAMSRAPGLGPLRLAAGPGLLVPAEHEQQETQTVEVAPDLHVRDDALPDQRHAAPLGPSHDGPGHAERARPRGRTGQDE